MKYWLSVLFVLCSWNLIAQEPAQNRIVIGGDSDYPPYEYINEDGQPDGYNVELSQKVARIIGVEPEFRLAKWALVRSWLEDGSIDIVQGMSFSIERAKELYFSGAHAVTWRTVFIRNDSNILSEADIMNGSVAIQQGDVAQEYLIQAGFSGQLSQVPSQEIALKLLDKGNFDACVANYVLAMHTIRNLKLKNIKALPQRIQQRNYCFASRDPELIRKVDAALIELSRSGELARLHRKWFGHLDADLVQRQSLVYGMAYAGIPLLLLAFILLMLFRNKNREITKIKAQLSNSVLELNAAKGKLEPWLDVFIEGPVILYRVTHHPMQLLYISENIKKWGYSSEQLCSEYRDFSEIIFSEDRERVIRQSDSLKQGECTILNYRTITKSGELRWVLDFCRPQINPNDSGLCFVGYLIDITAQKMHEAQLMEDKEKAEAANFAKSHFLANMSHEIRTPLNGITGFLQVLMQMDADEQQREIFDIMYSSSRNLLKIINDILDFSKIESGKLKLILSEFNPRYLIEDLIKQFEHLVTKEGLIIRAQIQDQIPDVLKGDQLRLKQILMNLLQNALKFTDHGQIMISAEIYTRSETDLRILFKVSDTGIGIDPIKQTDIFDNYSQVNSHITSKYGGTGLGLAIVKHLVELMNGFIWVESEPGKGSCFFFILPFSIYNELPQSETEHIHPEILIDQHINAKILLVEDEPVNQLVTKRQLETWGLTVDIANTGAEALLMYQNNHYDLILMDIQMPVMDGITATQKIRDMEVSISRHIPIVAFTAAALVGDRERFLAAGMDEYLAKPVEMNDMHRIIVKLLDN